MLFSIKGTENDEMNRNVGEKIIAKYQINSRANGCCFRLLEHKIIEINGNNRKKGIGMKERS